MALSANNIIFGLLFIILSLGYYIFYANPYHIVSLFKIPLIVLYIFIIFAAIIFMERHLNSPNNQVGELFSDFSFYFVKYFNFVILLIIMAIASYYLYRSFINTSVFLLSYSLWGTLGLLIIVLALLNQYSNNGTVDNPVLQLVKDIIMYIPCLLTDLIEFIKKDYRDTPTTTFILFIILVVYILFVYAIPEIGKQMYKNDGVTLITTPVYLNTNIISLSRNDLNEKIMNSLPFYDRWTQTLLLKLESLESINMDISGNPHSKVIHDLSANERDISANFTNIMNQYEGIINDISNNIPRPNNIIPIRENFTSVQNQDVQTINSWYNYLQSTEQNILNKLTDQDPQIQRDVNGLSFLWDNRPELLRAYISYLVLKHPDLLNVVDKTQILYSASCATGYTLLSIPSFLLGTKKDTGNLYHYAISFWVYFNTLDNCLEKQTILTFGLKPSLYYTPSNGELTVEINNKKKETIYRTNTVLFQRWNHIVMNYSYGKFDLFINNNLVSSRNLLPVMSPQEMLIVGSSDNSNVGGICNMKYYNIPLTASKINSIYKTFHKKSTPN
jgi:hypothetical protein